MELEYVKGVVALSGSAVEALCHYCLQQVHTVDVHDTVIRIEQVHNSGLL